MRSVPREEACQPNGLHSPDRPWPETNCYLDLWIELLPALGRDPMPLLGVALGLDWEADHFTFLKPAASDIFAATGVTLHELALWDDTEAQIIEQIATGAVPLLEVDAFYLPDTRSNAYRQVHTKTTIAISAIEPNRGWMEYFHNAGRFSLDGDDYAGVLGRSPFRLILFPYAELARVSGDQPAPGLTRELARGWLQRNARMRAPGNPVARFAAALPGLFTRVGTDPARINALCFNTTRQLGGTFGLLADHLTWLGMDHSGAAGLAEQAKSLQFQIARTARRGRAASDLEDGLDAMAADWARCVATVADWKPATSLAA